VIEFELHRKENKEEKEIINCRKKKSLKQNLPMTIMKKSKIKEENNFHLLHTKHYLKENLKKLKNLLIKYWRKKLTPKNEKRKLFETFIGDILMEIPLHSMNWKITH
jgi:hypothetical protein